MQNETAMMKIKNSPEVNPYASPKEKCPSKPTIPVDHDRGIGKASTIVKLIGVSLLSMFVGATILGCATIGAIGLFAGPVLMIFGWFYVPVVIGLHFLAWSVWPMFERLWLGRLIFGLAGALCGACIFALIGVKEQGSFLRFTVAYAISGGIAAFLSCMMIGWLRHESP